MSNHINARVNFQMRDDGLYVCFGLHERSEGCRWQRVDELRLDLAAR